MEKVEILERLNQTRTIIREIIKNDLRTGISWLTSVRIAFGNLDVAIQSLNKENKRIK